MIVIPRPSKPICWTVSNNFWCFRWPTAFYSRQSRCTSFSSLPNIFQLLTWRLELLVWSKLTSCNRFVSCLNIPCIFFGCCPHIFLLSASSVFQPVFWSYSTFVYTVEEHFRISNCTITFYWLFSASASWAFISLIARRTSAGEFARQSFSM